MHLVGYRHAEECRQRGKSEFAELARRRLASDTSRRHAPVADIGDMQELSVVCPLAERPRTVADGIEVVQATASRNSLQGSRYGMGHHGFRAVGCNFKQTWLLTSCARGLVLRLL